MSKYGSRRTVYGGQTYASKLEAEVAQRLDLMRYIEGPDTMVVIGVFPQVKFTLLPKEYGFPVESYVADFVVRFADDRIELWEAKGMETRLGRIKRHLLKHLCPWLCIRVIKE